MRKKHGGRVEKPISRAENIMDPDVEVNVEEQETEEQEEEETEEPEPEGEEPEVAAEEPQSAPLSRRPSERVPRGLVSSAVAG